MKYSIQEDKRRETGEESVKPFWRRINILDIIFIIIILIVALAVASFFSHFSLFGAGGERKIISYTTEIENIDGSMSGLLVVGDKVFDASGKNEIGIITAIKSIDTVIYVYENEAKGLKASTYPPDSNGNIPKTLRITIEATADYNAGGGYTVSGNRISVGTPINLCFTEFTGIGNCISVYVIGNASEVK